MKKLAIFDLDGTLFDTARVNFLAYEWVLAPRGFHPSWDYFRRECFGHDFGYFGPLLAPGAGPEEPEPAARRRFSAALPPPRDPGSRWSPHCTPPAMR